MPRPTIRSRIHGIARLRYSKRSRPGSWPGRIADGEPTIEDALAYPTLRHLYIDPYGSLSLAPEPQHEQQRLDEADPEVE
jgi:hypothetical protein